MSTDNDYLQKNKLISTEELFLHQNINTLSEKFFQENIRKLSRYNIERQWSSKVKPDSDKKQLKQQTQKKLSYWKYPARKLNRAVSEPSIQSIYIMETIFLQKSNSFHDLSNFNQRIKTSIKAIEPKIITWMYVTKAQCCNINFTKTDKDLLKVINGVFKWESSNEGRIMSRLLANIAKFCKKHDLTIKQMSTLMGIYYSTHLYNKKLNILSFEEIYDFFREQIIHHSVLTPPDHVLIFSLEEAKNILDFFLNTYLICLPLIRHICKPNLIMQIKWKRNHSSQII